MTWPPKPGAASAKPKRRNNHDEDDLQESVVAFLDLALPAQAGVFWSATLNGVRVTKKSVGRLTKLGLRKGVLDLVFIPLEGENAGQTFWLELKSKTGRPTLEQEKLMSVLRPAGRGEYARSIQEVEGILIGWGFPLRARL